VKIQQIPKQNVIYLPIQTKYEVILPVLLVIFSLYKQSSFCNRNTQLLEAIRSSINLSMAQTDTNQAGIAGSSTWQATSNSSQLLWTSANTLRQATNVWTSHVTCYQHCTGLHSRHMHFKLYRSSIQLSGKLELGHIAATGPLYCVQMFTVSISKFQENLVRQKMAPACIWLFWTDLCYIVFCPTYSYWTAFQWH